MGPRRILAGAAAAVGLGLLEAAWTGSGRGGPVDPRLGVLGILVVLLVVTWPRPWAVPGLAILEEATHKFVGYGWALPTASTLLHHWSVAFIHINLYPWATFPLTTVAGEVLYRVRGRLGLAVAPGRWLGRRNKQAPVNSAK